MQEETIEQTITKLQTERDVIVEMYRSELKMWRALAEQREARIEMLYAELREALGLPPEQKEDGQ